MIVGGDNGTTQVSGDRCDKESDFLTWLFSQQLNTRQASKVADELDEQIAELTDLVDRLTGAGGTAETQRSARYLNDSVKGLRKLRGKFKHRSLREGLTAAKFEGLMNAKFSPNVAAAQALIPSAVETSLQHMKDLGRERIKALSTPLKRESRRLYRWTNKRRGLLETRMQELGHKHPQAARIKRELEEMEAYATDRRENWEQANFTAAKDPSTRLVLVIEGVEK